jgi:hypothetical protein
MAKAKKLKGKTEPLLPGVDEGIDIETEGGYEIPKEISNPKGKSGYGNILGVPIDRIPGLYQGEPMNLKKGGLVKGVGIAKRGIRPAKKY